MKNQNNKSEKGKKLIIGKSRVVDLIFCVLVLLLISSVSVFAQTETQVDDPEISVCCEKTKQGAYCQNSQPEECDPNYRQTPTSCDATSFCKLGCCYDSQEGICMESTPQRVCEENNGTWADSKNCDIPQCNLGCCVLGDQAAFVPLVRCKRLSAIYALEVDFRRNVFTEVECVAIAQGADVGACVYEFEFENTCRFTTRAECLGIGRKAEKEVVETSGPEETSNKEPEEGITPEAEQEINKGNSITGEAVLGFNEGSNITGKTIKFYKDYLCTAEELGTNCGPTTETMCLQGKDEVYFKDSCGNPANIYDASKIYAKDKDYWRKVYKKVDSCGFNNNGNAGSTSCGNCDYFQGSICREYLRTDEEKRRPIYGDFICHDLNCQDTFSKQSYRHGETWCYYDSGTGNSADPVGSRHYRHLCYMGEEIVEACADYRQEQCIEDNINGFAQAGCRVNRWQDCTSQLEEIDCTNTDLRDCIWVEDAKLNINIENTTTNSETTQYSLFKDDEDDDESEEDKGACLPNIPPGLRFWEEGEAQSICAVANQQCVVEFEKGVFGDKKCKENCECLEDSWAETQNQVCIAIGDCGDKVNFIGMKGLKKGYETKTEKIKDDEDDEKSAPPQQPILNKILGVFKK